METVRLDREVHQTTAANGVVVLSERVPSVRSAAVGIWVRTASVHEPRSKMGVSHLLEHMVFKGTERRSAHDIALALESRGGALDAYTSRDTTAFQARVLDQDLPRAMDVLTDLVRRPLLRDADLELERNVVLEEISTVQDTPDDLVFDLSAETLWPKHPFGYSILGTRGTVGDLTTSDLAELHRRAYVPSNCAIVAAGNVDHEALLGLAAAEGWFAAPAGTGNVPSQPPAMPAVHGIELRQQKDSVQTHIVFSTDTVPFADPRKFPLMVLSNVFGGGMSSRLFQRIREELALAYSVYAYTNFFSRTGVLGVYVGTQPKSAARAADAIRTEFAKLAETGLSDEALEQAKLQTEGQLMLTLESPTARMYRLAASAVHGEPYRSLDGLLKEIQDVTRERVADTAAEFFDPARQTVVWLGPNGTQGNGEVR